MQWHHLHHIHAAAIAEGDRHLINYTRMALEEQNQRATEHPATRILDAWDPPLIQHGAVWVHDKLYYHQGSSPTTMEIEIREFISFLKTPPGLLLIVPPSTSPDQQVTIEVEFKAPGVASKDVSLDFHSAGIPQPYGWYRPYVESRLRDMLPKIIGRAYLEAIK